jgi:hypothetical protein
VWLPSLASAVAWLLASTKCLSFGYVGLSFGFGSGAWLLALARLGFGSVAWLLALAEWLWLGLALAKWLGYWLLASAIGLASAKWLRPLAMLGCGFA